MVVTPCLAATTALYWPSLPPAERRTISIRADARIFPRVRVFSRTTLWKLVPGPPQIEQQASTFLDRCVVIATSWAAHYKHECGRVGLLPCPRSFLLFMPDWEACRRTLGRASLFLDRVPVPTDYLNGKAGNRPTVVPVLHARGLSSWPRGVTTGSLDAKKSAMPCRGFLIRVILAGW